MLMVLSGCGCGGETGCVGGSAGGRGRAGGRVGGCGRAGGCGRVGGFAGARGCVPIQAPHRPAAASAGSRTVLAAASADVAASWAVASVGPASAAPASAGPRIRRPPHPSAPASVGPASAPARVAASVMACRNDRRMVVRPSICRLGMPTCSASPAPAPTPHPLVAPPHPLGSAHADQRMRTYRPADAGPCPDASARLPAAEQRMRAAAPARTPEHRGDNAAPRPVLRCRPGTSLHVSRRHRLTARRHGHG